MHIATSDQEPFEMGFGDYTCNWGLHVCGLYEGGDERDQIVFGYFRQGCADGDLQLYVPVERSEEEFVRDFSAACPECADRLADPSAFSFYSARELYYPDGTFSPDAMDAGLDAFFVESQGGGRRNIRATAEMVWALEAIPGVEQLMIYESRLNYFIPGKPWVSICLYNLDRFSGADIMNVLRTHPFTINKGIISRNPYYVDPDEWLSENAPEWVGRRRKET
jgi:hypothetical protein